MTNTPAAPERVSKMIHYGLYAETPTPVDAESEDFKGGRIDVPISSAPERKEGNVMKYYFLALATGVVVCVGCATNGDTLIHKQKRGYVSPPAQRLARPGPMVDGPGPGVIQAMASAPAARAFVTRTTQIRFVAPKKMNVGWQYSGGFAEAQLTAPDSYDFVQGATYRLKLTGIAGRTKPLYPTLQVYPAHPSTDSYLAHNSIPVGLTAEDLDQVASSNYVTKVIYLPDAKFQDLVADVDVLVSTRLEPGVEPVAEASKRGTIMAVLRIGNKEFREGAAAGTNGVQPASFKKLDGAKGEMAAPMPIGPIGGGYLGVPGPIMVGSYGRPGQPPIHPISGVGGIRKWGMPNTATPIGLPGPPHLPYGGPAGLRRHTIVNNTRMDIGRPVKDMLIEVQHNPGYRLPKPVSYIKYTENHPHYPPHQISYPAGGGQNCPGGNCP